MSTASQMHYIIEIIQTYDLGLTSGLGFIWPTLLTLACSKKLTVHYLMTLRIFMSYSSLFGYLNKQGYFFLLVPLDCRQTDNLYATCNLHETTSTPSITTSAITGTLVTCPTASSPAIIVTPTITCAALTGTSSITPTPDEPDPLVINDFNCF